MCGYPEQTEVPSYLTNLQQICFGLNENSHDFRIQQQIATTGMGDRHFLSCLIRDATV
jgi:hypothetical protein